MTGERVRTRSKLLTREAAEHDGAPRTDAPEPGEPLEPSVSARRRLGTGWTGTGSTARLLLGVVLVYAVLQLVFGRLEVAGLGIGRRSAPIPFGVFVNGAIIGSLYGLVGMGLILVYRANQVINFAVGALGSVPATLAIVLMQRKGLPYWMAVPLVLVTAPILGALVELVFLRRFRSSSRLIMTVATIGVGQVLLFAEVMVVRLISGQSSTPLGMRTPWDSLRFEIGVVRFTGDHLVVVAVVVAVAIGLGFVLRGTSLGIGIRASAENETVASLLGIPTARLSTIAWSLAGLLAALAVFLRGPLTGGTMVGGTVSPAFLMFGLAAAAIAGMERLPLALAAGAAIGMVDQAALFSTRRSSLTSLIVLGAVLGALTLRRRGTERAADTGVSSWQLTKQPRRVPAELRRVPEVRWVQAGLAAGLAVAALSAPVAFGCQAGGACLPTTVLLYAMVGLSLVVLTGWSGQISLGQFAIVGASAAIAGGMVTNLNADFFVVVAVAAIGGAAIAMVIGVPALRLPGPFLAVTTLAFTFVVHDVVLNRTYTPWLLPEDFEFINRPVMWGAIRTSSPMSFYFLTLAVFVVLCLLARSLRTHRSGRVIIGVRDNQRAMEAVGVSVVRTRLATFAIAGGFAGVAGAMFAYHSGAILPDAFTPAQSIQLFVMTVIGGISTPAGALLGSVFVFGLPHAPVLRDIDFIEFLTSGLGLLLVLMYAPGGLGEVTFRIRDNWLRGVGRRHQIHVPSLLKDSRVESRDDVAGLLASTASGLGHPQPPASRSRLRPLRATSESGTRPSPSASTSTKGGVG